MEALNRWLEEQTRTPVGSVLVFVAVFLVRIAADRWHWRRAGKKQHRRKGAANG
jgi:hypothetical protein